MQVLCDHHKNLFIVGDPDQTIYTWRGADVRFLLDFDKVYPTTRTILMMENYRSTPQILAVCNSLIEKNQDRIKKELLPMLPAGEGVLCHHAANSEQEARWLAEKLQELHAAGVRYRDMAVLYRAHYITRGVEEVLLKEKIPYTIYSGVQFFARAEIKDALSYLRMIACRDDLSFLRIANVPKRNLGERRMTFLKDYAAQNGCSLYDALRKNLDGELLRGTKAAMRPCSARRAARSGWTIWRSSSSRSTRMKRPAARNVRSSTIWRTWRCSRARISTTRATRSGS